MKNWDELEKVLIECEKEASLAVEIVSLAAEYHKTKIQQEKSAE